MFEGNFGIELGLALLSVRNSTAPKSGSASALLGPRYSTTNESVHTWQVLLFVNEEDLGIRTNPCGKILLLALVTPTVTSAIFSLASPSLASVRI